MGFAPLAQVQNLHIASAPAACNRYRIRFSRLYRAAQIPVALLLVCSASAAFAEDSPLLHVRGMTFVSTRANDDTVILRAERANLDTDEEMAYLERVDAEIPATDQESGFRMTCDTGEVNLATNDFFVTGNVNGSSDGGGNFSTEWVRYDHTDGVLFTDAPVIIVDDGITYRGVGFQYEIDERRFRLLGGTSVLRSAPTKSEQ